MEWWECTMRKVQNYKGSFGMSSQTNGNIIVWLEKLPFHQPDLLPKSNFKLVPRLMCKDGNEEKLLRFFHCLLLYVVTFTKGAICCLMTNSTKSRFHKYVEHNEKQNHMARLHIKLKDIRCANVNLFFWFLKASFWSDKKEQTFRRR